MKNYIVLCAFLMSSLLASAQNRVTKNVDSFNRISFGVPGKALVRQGSTQKVELEGSNDVLEKVEVVVEGGNLKIRNRDNWGSWNWGREDRITVYITATDIRGLSVSGSGTLETQTKIVTGDLELKVSGSGNLRAEVESNNLEVGVSGSGDLQLRGKANNMESSISGSGGIEANITVADEMDVSISGSGGLLASGKSNSFEATISGSGKVRALEMETNSCEVKISGSGSVEITVNKELNATISGSGSVSYRGNPDHVNAHSSGSGKVRKIS
jgi:hypothetical protein